MACPEGPKDLEPGAPYAWDGEAPEKLGVLANPEPGAPAPEGPKDLEAGAPYACEGAAPEKLGVLANPELGATAPEGPNEPKRAGELGPLNGVLKKLPLPPAFWALPGGRYVFSKRAPATTVARKANIIWN